MRPHNFIKIKLNKKHFFIFKKEDCFHFQKMAKVDLKN